MVESIFRIHGFHALWPPIPWCSAKLTQSNVEVLQPQNKFWFRLFPVRSSLTKGISFDFFSSGYLDISVPRVAPPPKAGPPRFRGARLPYSDTAGSSAFTRLPDDFRGVNVLLRPNKPRHPLSALV